MKAMCNQPIRIGTLILASVWASCSTNGTAVGELKTPAGKEESVTLVWKSDATNPQQGSISGTLPDGIHYSGRYFEVVSTANAESYAAAWDGWAPYWREWNAPWYDGPTGELDSSTFVTIYSGRVIANLTSDDQHVRVRCRFAITNPPDGLAGGGSGQCQLSNGETIGYVTLAAN